MNLNNLVAVSCFIFPVFFRWSVRALRSRAVNSLVSCPMFELPQYVSSVGEKDIDQIRYCKFNIRQYTHQLNGLPTFCVASLLLFLFSTLGIWFSSSCRCYLLPLNPPTMSWMGHSAWLNEVAPYTVYTGTGFCCSFLRNAIATQLWRFFFAFRRVRGVCRRPNATDLFTGHSDCWGHPLAI